MNNLIYQAKKATQVHRTENGDLTHDTTLNEVLDLFAFGGSYRERTDEEIERLFSNAFVKDPNLAIRCLFYLRDREQGQGERRFFRVCYKWLCVNSPVTASYILPYIPTFGRWDDMFVAFDTSVEAKMVFYVKNTLKRDYVRMQTTNNVSLLAKWMPSINTSSKEKRAMARRFCKAFGWTQKAYRQTLSKLRKHLNIVERKMSSNDWDAIEFDKLPSRAGFLYGTTFLQKEQTHDRYVEFLNDKRKKVNTSVLYPYDVIHQVTNKANIWYSYGDNSISAEERKMFDTYWNNLPDFFDEEEHSILPMIDVSGSMGGRPIEVALGIGFYVAERCHGDFNNHFITFSARPQMVEIEGYDLFDKIRNAMNADWGMNTNLYAVFNLLETLLRSGRAKAEDLPDTILIISDMEFDEATDQSLDDLNTELEAIKDKWKILKWKFPNVVFWNANARNNNIPAIGEGFSYVSGVSPSIMRAILTNATGYDLMMEALMVERYDWVDSFLKRTV